MGQGKFEPRRVKVGVAGDDGYTEIKEGLFDGEQVVVSAQFMFDSESKLKEAIQKMLNPEPIPEPQAQGDDDDLEDLFGDDKEDLESLFEEEGDR